MDYVVAIPSYKRHLTVKQKTLKMLVLECVPHDKIHIFCVAEEEELYKESCHGYKVIVGAKGLVNQRNFIYNYFPENTNIVFIDDDISSIMYLQNTVPLDQTIKLAFENVQILNLRLFGIYPVANKFFMKPVMSQDLRYIVGAFFGLIKRGPSLMNCPSTFIASSEI